MAKINLKDLRQAIKEAQRGSFLMKVLKEELTLLGYWRVKPRGDSAKGFKMGWGKRKSCINPQG